MSWIHLFKQVIMVHIDHLHLFEHTFHHGFKVIVHSAVSQN